MTADTTTAPELLPWETHNPGDLASDRVNITCPDADVIIVANLEKDAADLIVSEHNRLCRAPVAQDHRSFPEAADGRPMPPMGDDLMIAGLNGDDARFVAIQLAQNGLALVPVAQDAEWSGSPCPDDPDGFWICDKTGARIPAHPAPQPSDEPVAWPSGFFELSGDARLRECATDGCYQCCSIRMERGGVGSDYCEPCARKIAAPQPSDEAATLLYDDADLEEEWKRGFSAGHGEAMVAQDSTEKHLRAQLAEAEKRAELPDLTCPGIDAAISALEDVRKANSQMRYAYWHIQAELDEARAALAAAEDHADMLAAFVAGTYAGDPATAEKRRKALAAHQARRAGE